MTLPTVGILGLGYLGRRLFRNFSWAQGSWGTEQLPNSSPTVFEPHLEIVPFDWDDASTWDNLPNIPTSIVLTIPPIKRGEIQERERLVNWCDWIRTNRQEYRDVSYVSSTGVYPNKAGLWTEDSRFEPDTLKGRLRRDTEQILNGYFKLRVIRSGAIYGANRHIGQRILRQDPIPKGNQPVHRIHVDDLANILKLAATQDSFPSLVNAVDQDPASTEAVATWLANQDFFPLPLNARIPFKEGYFSRKHSTQNPKRRISNSRLMNDCKYEFLFPTYKEGLREAVELKTNSD